MSGFNKSRNVYLCPICGTELWDLDFEIDYHPNGNEELRAAECGKLKHCQVCERNFIAGGKLDFKKCSECKIKVDCLTYENVSKGRRKR